MVEYSGDHLISISIACLVLNTLFILGRLVSRLWIKQARVGWDDVFALLGYVACVGMSAVGIIIVRKAKVGYHVHDALAMDPNALLYWGEIVWAQESVYLAAISLPKLSVCALYLRIWSTRKTRICIWTLIFLVVAYWISFQVGALLQCRPLRGVWDKTVPAVCFDNQTFFNFVSLPSAIIDLLIITFPIPLLIHIQAPPGKKILYIALFFCGSLGIAADLTRMVMFLKISAFDDSTWASVYLIGVTIIEPTMYLFAACLVSMGPFYQLLFDRIWLEPYKAAWRKFCRERLPETWRSRLPKSWTRAAPQLPPPAQLSRTEWFGAKFSRVTMVSQANGGRYADDSLLLDEDGIGMRRQVWVERTPKEGVSIEESNVSGNSAV